MLARRSILAVRIRQSSPECASFRAILRRRECLDYRCWSGHGRQDETDHEHDAADFAKPLGAYSAIRRGEGGRCCGSGNGAERPGRRCCTRPGALTMAEPRSPSLYQINTRVWLTELSRTLGRPATLDDIPDAELDRVAGTGFDWIWFLSVWQTGAAGQAVSRANPEWRHEFEETLPDLDEEDIAGSGFAITGYTVHQQLGGDAALARLRERLRRRGLRLMLDFVPNHMALDHPWVEEHPDFFIAGEEPD